MFTFDITPKVKLVPGNTAWGNSAIPSPLSQQMAINIESLHDLETEYRVRTGLNAINIQYTKWSSELLSTIAQSSYPLRELLSTKTSIDASVSTLTEWLTYWEVYARCLAPQLTSKISARMENLKERAKTRAKDRKEEYEDKEITLRGFTFKTFHIRGGVTPMQKMICNVEFKTGVQITWDYLATYTNDMFKTERVMIEKNKKNWLTGIDGDGTTSVANMRAWRNKIVTNLKVIDALICNDAEDVVNNIAFALINVNAGGIVIIYLPVIDSTSISSMIHLFSHSFEKTEIIHTVAEDRMYLCGINFLNNITSKHHKLLYDYCEREPASSDISPFVLEYTQGDMFLETQAQLLIVNNTLQGWRYDHYEKILMINAFLIKSASATTFISYVDKYLSDQYIDESKKWIISTGFDFFIQNEL